LEVIETDRPIMRWVTPWCAPRRRSRRRYIRIDIGQFLRCSFSERIIEEERNIIRTLEVNEITHRFGKGGIGLEESPLASRVELVA